MIMLEQDEDEKLSRQECRHPDREQQRRLNQTHQPAYTTVVPDDQEGDEAPSSSTNSNCARNHEEAHPTTTRHALRSPYNSETALQERIVHAKQRRQQQLQVAADRVVMADDAQNDNDDDAQQGQQNDRIAIPSSRGMFYPLEMDMEGHPNGGDANPFLNDDNARDDDFQWLVPTTTLPTLRLGGSGSGSATRQDCWCCGYGWCHLNHDVLEEGANNWTHLETTSSGMMDRVYLIQIAVTVTLLLPLMWAVTAMMYALTDRIWTAAPWIVHGMADGIIAMMTFAIRPSMWSSQPSSNKINGINKKKQQRHGRPRCIWTCSPWCSVCCCCCWGARTSMLTICLVLLTLVDGILFGIVDEAIWTTLRDVFFTEPDGTTVMEWTWHRNYVWWFLSLGRVIVACRCFGWMLLVGYWLWSWSQRRHPYNPYHHPEEQQKSQEPQMHDQSGAASRIQPLASSSSQIKSGYALWALLRWMLHLEFLVSLVLTMWCLSSLAIHVGSWPAPPTRLSTSTTSQNDSSCDDRDETECWLPFPSFRHLIIDAATDTGYRVHMTPSHFPPLKSGRRRHHPLLMDMSFHNQLDGFSTMAPVMFYLNGLKEAHEAGIAQLPTPDRIVQSIGSLSCTILLDVEAQTVVPHSAEIDYLDIHHPVVLLTPAQPLHHQRQYAVAVVNAVNATGQLLPPTLGMQKWFSSYRLTSNDSSLQPHQLYHAGPNLHVVVEALQTAAPWLSAVTTDIQVAAGSDRSDPPFGSSILQLLFSFVTVSERCQLGTIRAIRDHTIRYIQSNPVPAPALSPANGGKAVMMNRPITTSTTAPVRQPWIWADHVRTNRIIDTYDQCPSNLTGSDHRGVLARTIHAELDVPWFLQGGYGPNRRDAHVDENAVAQGQPVDLGVAKFVLLIPCSVRAAIRMRIAATQTTTTTTNEEEQQLAKPLRAIIEYGHGLFGNRMEVTDEYLVRMAHQEGYLLMAMDWRGMSVYDLPVVAKALIANPRSAQAVRDNLYQCYANKYALQDFARRQMLHMVEWFRFNDNMSKSNPIVPTWMDQTPVHVFYGNSQGGILGAGYAALSGGAAGGLIDRVVLGVPGTPFAYIIPRSIDFGIYDALFLFNLYENRHVLFILYLLQMGWDSVEGAGVLAPPVREPVPRTLMQAGLGDVYVSTLAAEALARAMNASLLANNPRANQPFGLPVEDAAGDDDLGPDVTLTELLYVQEYLAMPSTDTVGQDNDIHKCVRQDPSMIVQFKEFVNTGRVINPCQVKSDCVRYQASCQ